MASHFHTTFPSAAISAPQRHHLEYTFHSFITQDRLLGRGRLKQIRKSSRIKVSDGADLSYLDMWKTAVGRERKSLEFQRIVENSGNATEEEESPEALERKSNEFKKILEFPPEERDQIQRLQVIDRAAAAISAARALLKENPRPQLGASGVIEVQGGENEDNQQGLLNESLSVPQSGNTISITPGPSFWSWIPPPDISLNDENKLKADAKLSASPNLTSPVIEKERSAEFLPIPFESVVLGSSKTSPSLPPLQSLVEVDLDTSMSPVETPPELGAQFSTHAAEAVLALEQVISDGSSYGVNPDGSKWWKETGNELRPDGVLCKWTVMRGVSSDKAVEWENKYWEAADELGYKELGSEKSGRDAAGSVWREYWKESMSESNGLVHMEKTADKWGRNGRGEEWQEQWLEKYDATGQAEKWAHKWCTIDPNTPLDAGHAHLWHERWGEKFDGQGGAMKYTDKWAERCEGDGWSKWGDKWDEHFDNNGHGVKQGETWWEGKHGDRWNRTWGEGHNGSGWVHKYGKSSSGEHWDTHAPQETWYERFPHFGFYHCFENSVQLRQVKRPSESP
ncbi:unnamed protein product [Cuscuta epithymum]|uniref:Uncharacterized protein n=1 Tax=Cuscuta epithymum TaxID=186058 RepID=A0AAV0GD02_9ASTE|nr:unnamed protein product [Cuscuta epithymum]